MHRVRRRRRRCRHPDDIASRFTHAGQVCTSIKRLIVDGRRFEEVIGKLCAVIATKKVGRGVDADTDIGPLVARRQLDLLEAQVEDAVAKGAHVVVGGRRPGNLRGAYYLPTVLTGVTSDMRVWREEVFGPVLPVVPFVSEEDAIELANDMQYGLGAHVMTRDHSRFERVARRLQSGMVAENTVSWWNPLNPFGGYKKSGMGRTHGEFGFHEVTQVKLVSSQR